MDIGWHLYYTKTLIDTILDKIWIHCILINRRWEYVATFQCDQWDDFCIPGKPIIHTQPMQIQTNEIWQCNFRELKSRILIIKNKIQYTHSIYTLNMTTNHSDDTLFGPLDSESLCLVNVSHCNACKVLSNGWGPEQGLNPAIREINQLD